LTVTTPFIDRIAARGRRYDASIHARSRDRRIDRRAKGDPARRHPHRATHMRDK